MKITLRGTAWGGLNIDPNGADTVLDTYTNKAPSAEVTCITPQKDAVLFVNTSNKLVLRNYTNTAQVTFYGTLLYPY